MAAATYDLPPAVEEAIARTRGEHLTYLRKNDLRELATIVIDADTNQLPGLIVEAGTARGGSAIVMAAAKAPDRPMKVYDVFGMIPPPSEQDGAESTGATRRSPAARPRASAATRTTATATTSTTRSPSRSRRLGVPVDERNVDLVRGLFEDTIDLDEPVAFAHLDGDWYESTMTCLRRIAPLVVPGGRIVLDDYDHWSGCRAAVDEYFEGREGFRLEQKAKLHVIREP